MLHLTLTELRYQWLHLAGSYLFILAFGTYVFGVYDGDPQRVKPLMLLPVFGMSLVPVLIGGSSLWNIHVPEKRLRLWGPLPLGRKDLGMTRLLTLILFWTPMPLGVALIMFALPAPFTTLEEIGLIGSICSLGLALTLTLHLLRELLQPKTDFVTIAAIILGSFFLPMVMILYQKDVIVHQFQAFIQFMASPVSTLIFLAVAALMARLSLQAFAERARLD